MTNLLEQAINCDDGDLAAKIIQDALGIESDDVANYCFPKEWPTYRERRAAVIGEMASVGSALSRLTSRWPGAASAALVLPQCPDAGL